MKNIVAISPIMTAQTTPSGKATSSSQSSNDYIAFKGMTANDNVETNRWCTAANVQNAWIKYQFPSAVAINRVDYKMRPAVRKTKDGAHDCSIILQGSNDDVTYTDITTFTELATNADNYELHYFQNTTAYTYYRLQFVGYNITFGNNYYCGISLLRFLSVE